MIVRILAGIFLILHGAVHMLYFGQSARIFELSPGMNWPDGAWTLSRLVGTDVTRQLADILLLLAALIFVVSGAATFMKAEWWRTVVVAAAIFSTAVYILLWDGRFENLANNGWVGILINLGILAIVYLFNWQPA